MGGFVDNKFYNNPQFAQAASGLASLFGPPSVQEVAASSAAIAARQKAERLAMLFAAGGSPSESAALAGVQGFGNTPEGFTYNVDSRDATARYGYDQGLAGTKYTADTQAETLRSNNVRDNETAMYGHDTDLAGTKYTADQALNEAIFGTAYGPLNPGQVRPAIPAEEAAMFGLEGAISGATGAPKPMTETEARGNALQGQIESGALSDDQLLAMALGNDTVMVDGPNGPTYMNPGEAAATGAPAFVNRGAEAAPATANWQSPDGRTGTAYFDRASNTYIDTQTQQPIPEGSNVFSAQAQGSRGDVTGATTANVTRGNEQVAEARYALGRIGEFEKLLNDNPGVLGVPGAMRGLFQDLIAGVDEFAAYQNPDSVLTLDAVKEVAARAGANGAYDPAISEARARALEMAYLTAKMQDPSGEVNVRELERMLGLYDGGIAGNQKVLANLTALRTQAEARLRSADELRTGPEGGAPAATDDIPTVSTPEEARRLPSGTQFRDPDGNLRIVP